MTSQKICKKCVLPESKPDIWLDEDGLCNVCIEYVKIKDSAEEVKPLETDFVKMLKLYKSHREYDCLYA